MGGVARKGQRLAWLAGETLTGPSARKGGQEKARKGPWGKQRKGLKD